MADVIYNRYNLRFSPSGSLSIDACDFPTAIRLGILKRGVEPIMASLVESNVYVASAPPSATFLVESMLDDEITAQAGTSYPQSATLPVGNQVCVTSVPNEGYDFVRYEDKTGKILCEEDRYIFTLMEDTTIRAVYQKKAYDPEAVSITPTISKLLRVNRDDGNYAVSQHNQDSISIATELLENTNTMKVFIVGHLDDLNTYPSTAGMGDCKWVGIVIDTNESYKKTDIWYNTTILPASEFTDANYLGVIGDGAFIVWMDAAAIKTNPKRFSVHTNQKAKKMYFEVSFEEE